MARIQSVSLSNAEGKAIDDFLEIHKELNMNQLLKQALAEYLSRFSTSDHVPAHIQRLVDDLETWKRWKYERAQNITWLTGRHGITPATAEKAVDYFLKGNMVL